MARKQLINLHSSQVKHPSQSNLNPAIAIGEIVIQAVPTAATIYTKVSANDYAEFIDKTQIQTLITNAITASSVSDRVEALETSVSALSGTVTTIEPMAKSALQNVTASGANAYVSASAGTKTGGDGQGEQEITVTANVAGDISAATNNSKLADAYKVKVYVDKVVGDEATARGDADTTLNNKITALTQTVDYGFSGLTIDSTHSVKTYIDNLTGSVYRVKGTVANEGSLPTEKVAGDVYNITAASSYGPAGTNVVWDGSQWDALGGTWDLSPYAYVTALTTEVSNRQDADAEINAKIGGNYSSSSTVHSAIQAAQTAADNKLASVSASGNGYVGASAGTVSGNAGSKTQAITVTPSVATDLQSVGSGDTKLADAYAVKVAINAATAATKAVSDKLDTVSGTVNTLSSTVASLTANSVSNVFASGDNYVSLSTSRTNGDVTITAAADVAGDFSAITTDQTQLANAYKAKQYIDAQVADAVSGTSAVSDRVTTLENKIGTNSSFGTAHTISDAVAALESGAVTSVSVDNTSTNGITATKTGNAVALNFDNIVVDCGEY